MNLATAPDRARTVKGPKAAAKMYADIEFELAMGDPSFEDEHAGELALEILQSSWPDVKDQSDNAVEDGHVPALSRKAKTAVFPKDDDGAPAPSVPPAARAAVQGRRRSRSFGSSAGGAWASTGVPALAGGTGGLGLQALGALVGLSLAYLALSPNGAKAVAAFAGGINTAANVFVNVGDPFATKQSAAAPATAAPATAATATAATATAAAPALTTNPPSVKTASG